jgi:hypothetical protein
MQPRSLRKQLSVWCTSRMMLRSALFSLALAAGAAAQAPEADTWTARDGRQFSAKLVAADGLRATFAAPDKPKFSVTWADLAAADADRIRQWRALTFRLPLVDPECLAPWPPQVVPEPVEVKFIGEDGGHFIYESAHFRLIADFKLPDAAVRDIATVFEATRSMLMAIPLGLHAGGEHQKYVALLLGTQESYAAAGGPPGSGGYYEGRTRRMLVSLPNLGIEQKRGSVQLNYGRSLFVLKHEVTHQLLARWNGGMPMWLSEGLAEVVASLPYHQGRYTIQNPGAGMRDYILKWRKSRDDRSIRLVPATELMAMDDRDWRMAVEQQTAYDRYNSAGLLALYFIQQDDGVPLAACLDALRRNHPGAEEALLRGRTREQVAAAVAAMAKKMGLEVK